MGPRRPTVATPRAVVEFQHSPISPEEIRAREAFYGRKLVWVFDVRAAYARTDGWLDVRERGSYHTFRWPHPWRSLAAVTRPMWFDLGDDLLKAKE